MYKFTKENFLIMRLIPPFSPVCLLTLNISARMRTAMGSGCRGTCGPALVWRPPGWWSRLGPCTPRSKRGPVSKSSFCKRQASYFISFFFNLVFQTCLRSSTTPWCAPVNPARPSWTPCAKWTFGPSSGSATSASTGTPSRRSTLPSRSRTSPPN